MLGFKKVFLDAPVLNWVDDLNAPIYGSAETRIDAWVSYRRPLTEKIDMSIQLNVRNLFSDRELVGVTANPDGSVGSYRMAEGTTWELTSRFEFLFPAGLDLARGAVLRAIFAPRFKAGGRTFRCGQAELRRRCHCLGATKVHLETEGRRDGGFGVLGLVGCGGAAGVGDLGVRGGPDAALLT
ncbi:MAG: TonB-dependent receptor [Candidatus Synoicihabitans palmerolidicus]|nr:TonB-dependent receptor [Candidatus Synoicihabitans palmerolidicus]